MFIPIRSNTVPIRQVVDFDGWVLGLPKQSNINIMTTQRSTKPERQYYIDWLRILLILSVFLFHIGMIFILWDWHVKNDVIAGYKSTLWYIMVFLGRWRMPLLILISGAGTYFALGKRTTGQYLGERFRRLIIPLIAGIFILVPVKLYIEKSAQYE